MTVTTSLQEFWKLLGWFVKMRSIQEGYFQGS